MRNRAPASDAEILFVSVFGATLVVLLHRLLLAYLSYVGDGTRGPSLLARTAPLGSVALLFTFFVMLPAILAVAAIGVPHFLRTIGQAWRGRLASEARNGVLLLAASAVAAVVEGAAGGSGSLSAAASCVLALRFGIGPIAALGAAYGSWVLASAGLALGVLGWFEAAVVRGREAGIALAPTALVAAAFLGPVGAVTAGAAAAKGQGARSRAALTMVALLTWLLPPPFRHLLSGDSTTGDRLEVGAVVVAAALFVLASRARRRT